MPFSRLKGRCRIVKSSKEIASMCGSGSSQNVWVATDSETVQTVRGGRNEDY
jgi:hypothetical protein